MLPIGLLVQSVAEIAVRVSVVLVAIQVESPVVLRLPRIIERFKHNLSRRAPEVQRSDCRSIRSETRWRQIDRSQRLELGRRLKGKH